MDQSTSLPPRLAEILDDFALSDRQEKMELLLEFSTSLLPVPAGLADTYRPARIRPRMHDASNGLYAHPAGTFAVLF